MNVGIDGIGIAVPPTYLNLTELADARGVAREKFTDGLGTLRMAVPLPDEDTVTLAVRAGQAALAASETHPSEIGLCIVGTETAVDHSKPVSSFVQGLLGLGRGCRVFETKHACYGGTAGLQTALDWIRAGSADGKKALVICSDIARYGLRTAGEPTQGAGAVALVVAESPALVAMDPGLVGTDAHDVFDFWRPLYSKDAFVDGHYSVTCYLDALRGAYGAYRDKARARGVVVPAGGPFSDAFAALAYHVPYGKMARKAHRALREFDGDADPDASFDRLVASSLRLPNEVGNIYTGSLYLALASMLATSGADLGGRRVGLFSYGSGCCAEFFSGVVEPAAQARVRALDLPGMLAARRALSLGEYEQAMGARDGLDERGTTGAVATPPSAGDRVAYLGATDHRRVYFRAS
jgi:hydroxymethylglutaryl-CoA synthase